MEMFIFLMSLATTTDRGNITVNHQPMAATAPKPMHPPRGPAFLVGPESCDNPSTAVFGVNCSPVLANK